MKKKKKKVKDELAMAMMKIMFFTFIAQSNKSVITNVEMVCADNITAHLRK